MQTIFKNDFMAVEIDELEISIKTNMDGLFNGEHKKIHSFMFSEDVFKDILVCAEISDIYSNVHISSSNILNITEDKDMFIVKTKDGTETIISPHNNPIVLKSIAELVDTQVIMKAIYNAR